ncbi:hypothetical protein [Sphingobacterium sp. IITKGP-BTPF85]|uniref:hypothetical protein n=1 Tax=Sphingobacterium sp. IITKGP-BTPF85 TaxID=1338009 RepID=UPI00038A17FB|nr:hypothetical protein [Sphingobacterium sp. IITKGP-BTPF85]KKX50392.1 hypothetical protein L950_0210580 [Sphingobacterium sp. IITKGP-BTPF85]
MIFKTAFHALTTAFKGLSLTVKHLFGARKARQELDITKDNYFDKQDGIATDAVSESFQNASILR